MCALVYYGWPLITSFVEAVTPDEKGMIGGVLASCSNYVNQFTECFRDLANGLTGNDTTPINMDKLGYSNFDKAPESITD